MCCGDDDESIHSLEHVIRVHEFEPLFLRSHLAFGHDRHTRIKSGNRVNNGLEFLHLLLEVMNTR